jgi:hypothetical protein
MYDINESLPKFFSARIIIYNETYFEEKEITSFEKLETIKNDNK